MQKYSTSISVILLLFGFALFTSCRTTEPSIHILYDTELDAKVFDLLITSMLAGQTYTSQNLKVSTLPVRNETSIPQEEWVKEIEQTKIQHKRRARLDKNKIKEIKLSEYNSCHFEHLVPPTGEQKQDNLSEECLEFENTYALVISLPEKGKKSSSVSVIAGIYSNYGYTYYRYTLSNAEQPAIINREKISWIYS